MNIAFLSVIHFAFHFLTVQISSYCMSRKTGTVYVSYDWGCNSMVSVFTRGHDVVNHQLGHLFGFPHDSDRTKNPHRCSSYITFVSEMTHTPLLQVFTWLHATLLQVATHTLVEIELRVS